LSQTDGRTDGKTGFSSPDRVCIAYSAVKINVKTYQFKIQCKGDNASKTATITVFDPVICKTSDAP